MISDEIIYFMSSLYLGLRQYKFNAFLAIGLNIFTVIVYSLLYFLPNTSQLFKLEILMLGNYLSRIINLHRFFLVIS